MTGIEWTDETWNPVRGCSRVSPGCDHCYAMGQARRSDVPDGAYEGLTRIGKRGVDWSGRVRLVPEMLDAPLRWRKPRRVFVNSMSDLFHESLSNEQIAAVFGVMAAAHRHTFQVLTKRAKRMRQWFAWADEYGSGFDLCRGTMANALMTCAWEACTSSAGDDREDWTMPTAAVFGTAWPLPNVWLGVSAEDQQRADERIPHLLATPAAVRFVSCEPLLGWVDLSVYLREHCCDEWPTERARGANGCAAHPMPALSWVIAGGESGHGARPCDVAWIRSIVEQCRDADVACFVKQLGAHYVDAPNGVGGVQANPDPTVVPPIRHLTHRKGGDPSEWPVGLRVRQFPEVPT